MLKRLLSLAVFTAVALVARANHTEDAQLTYFRDLAETRNYTLGRPVSPKITPDGAHVIFLRAEPRNPTLRLYEFDIARGTERELLAPEKILGDGEEKLSAEEKTQRERMRQSLRGFTSFSMTEDGAKLLVILSGKLYVVNRHDLTFAELPGSGWLDPRFSPNGRFVAAVKDRELHVIDLESNESHVVTSGAGGAITHATAEFVAQEEMSRFHGYWWSPDASQFLYQQTDESAVETRYIANLLHPEEAPASFKYPKAGSPNAVVRVGLISRHGGETTWVQWDNQTYPYLARVTWNNPRAPLTLLVQNREQTEQVLLAVDPANGSVRELLKESDAAWLNLDASWAGATNEVPAPLWLADGSHFLWATEQRGAWQVELRNATGAFVREITPLHFRYRGLLGIDEASHTLFVRGSLDPREIHLWKFPLHGGEGTQLTQGCGHHLVHFGGQTGKLVHSSDLFDGSYRTQLIDLNGHAITSMKVSAETLPRLPTTELTRTEGTHTFDAAITRPNEFKADQKYPVILQVYGGPTSKRVNATIRDYLTDQWMADHGYIVIRIDGRGTPWQNREWDRVFKNNFIDVVLTDQIAGLQALAQKHPEIDLSRVGVTGWSWGGYFSAMATIRRPDIFRAGLVGAPVITWENYDTHYTERYLGLPQQNPEAYRVSNVTTYVDQLQRPLLLIHGLTDDNVYFQHTLQLADALFMAGKSYELLPLTGTHMINDPRVRLRQQQRIMEFFGRHVRDIRVPK